MDTKKYYTSKGHKYGVAISTPEDPTKTEAILICHGRLARDTMGNSDVGLDYILNSELPAIMAPLGERFILCSTKLPAGRWDDNNFDVIQHAYDLLIKEVAPSKVFIVGHSWGGQAASGYPASSPARKAAIAATITISGCKSNVTTYASLKDYPIYFVHDINDAVVVISEAEGVYKAIGGTQPFDKLVGYGHGYLPNYVVSQKKYWDWLSKQGTVATPPTQPPVAKTIKRVTIEFSDGTSQVTI